MDPVRLRPRSDRLRRVWLRRGEVATHMSIESAPFDTAPFGTAPCGTALSYAVASPEERPDPPQKATWHAEARRDVAILIGGAAGVWLVLVSIGYMITGPLADA